ncbi:helix-turn-helix transcriptional regulator [Desulfobacterota bacterium AH_259_B03_O07]|nr:helix-turn-helix transcriptional regulator [Desulfobacterota bacterium AH_259_B03_O07]
MTYIKCHLSKILGERRVTQRELGRMSGLSSFTINKFYNERWKGIDQYTLVALCKSLNVQVGDLFEYVETKDKSKKIKPRPRRK